MTTKVESTPRSNRGTLTTVKNGLALSPELRRGLWGTIAIAVIATAGRVVVPIAIQRIVDGGFSSDGVDMTYVIRMTLLAFGAVIMTGLATGWMHLRLAKVSETALSGLRIRAFRHIHDLSMLHQASEQRGVLVARVTSDVDQISRFMQWSGLQLLVNGLQALLAVVVMLTMSVPLTLVVLATTPLVVWVIVYFQGRLETAYMVVREKVGQMLALIAETVVGAPVIRAYGIEERTRERLQHAIEGHRRAGVRAGRLSSTFSGFGELTSGVILAAVVVAGTILAANGSATLGTIIAFLFLVQLFVEPVQYMGEAVNEAQTAVVGWSRVLDILDIAPDVADPGPAGVALPHHPLDARFRDVGFQYPRPGQDESENGSTPALIGIDVEIPPQQRVAIVGETGSGKSTFAKLLTRLMDPTSGSVEVGGIDLRTVRFESLRDRVVMVPQEGILFRGSIADNVAMGSPGASREELLEAFTRLGLIGWLSEMPQGLDTQVGERGSSLSVGERQLVTLVRAAIADPDLLVLDEATSAVDPATEVRISSALNQLTAGRTVVTIAHRLSTAEAADRVLVFDGGRLVEDGSHEELLARSGIYSGLYESWQRGTVNR